MNARGRVIALALFVGGMAAWAQDARAIAVQLLVNPPYTLAEATPEGEPAGFVPDLFRAVKIPGYRWEFQIKPWARILADTLADREGTVILPTLTRTKDRESSFTWVAPLFSPRYYFLQKGRQPGRRDLESLKSRSVAVLLGNTSDGWLKANGFKNLFEVASLELMVKLVDIGRADLLLKDMTSLSYFLKSLGLPPGYFTIVAEVKELNQPLYVAGSLALPPDLASAIREKITALQESGKLEQLWNRWQ